MSNQNPSDSAFFHSLECGKRAIENLASNESRVSALGASISIESTIYTLGIGKMAFVAAKFSASLRSLGVDAHFLDSTHLAHGDLGAIRRNSFVFAFTKSGNSAELKTVIPFFLDRSNTVVVITNNERSPVAAMGDITLLLNVEDEGDPLNLMPLASTLSAMALADAFVASLASQWKFSAAQFGNFHPAGQIGANLNRNLADLSTWKARKPFVRANASISEAMKAIGSHLCGLACVVDVDGRLIAVVSDGDLRRALMDSAVGIHGKINTCMNPHPTVIDASATFEDAYRIMESGSQKLSAIPVVSESICLGVMLVHDLF
jgi:arabinose-5-phosphate isomerase